MHSNSSTPAPGHVSRTPAARSQQSHVQDLEDAPPNPVQLLRRLASAAWQSCPQSSWLPVLPQRAVRQRDQQVASKVWIDVDKPSVVNIDKLAAEQTKQAQDWMLGPYLRTLKGRHETAAIQHRYRRLKRRLSRTSDARATSLPFPSRDAGKCHATTRVSGLAVPGGHERRT